MRSVAACLYPRVALCPVAFLAGLIGLTACSPADYTDGITAFSTAVDKAKTAEQALIAAYQQNVLDRAIAGAGSGSVSYTHPDLKKCAAQPYHAGDCAVMLGGKPVTVTIDESSMGGLTQYAALLSSVTTDKTCDTLTTDTKGLETAINDVAKVARNTAIAPSVTSIGSIVATIGCQAIESMQLKILRQATMDANPSVQQLTKVIADKDNRLQERSTRDLMAQLAETASQYDSSKSAADLRQVIALTKAVDQAHLIQAGPVVQKLGELHQTLTDDLASPNVTLKRVQSDAQALIAEAEALRTAATTLANPSGAKAK